MGIRKHKPTTPGRRGSSVLTSKKSPAAPRKSRWFARFLRPVAATTRDASPLVTSVEATSASTA